MLIKVTRKDRYSSGTSCFTCPIATAINRVLPTGEYAAVYGERVFIHRRITDKHNVGVYTRCVGKAKLPRSARRFINRYDNPYPIKKRKAKPFNFRLDIEYT